MTFETGVHAANSQKLVRQHEKDKVREADPGPDRVGSRVSDSFFGKKGHQFGAIHTSPPPIFELGPRAWLSAHNLG